MKIKNWSLIAGALILTASLTYTPALTQDAPGTKKDEAKRTEGATQKPDANAKPKTAAGRRVAKIDPTDGKLISPYSVAERTALNKQDCRPNNLHKDGLGIHGHYRTYGQWDP